MHTQNSRKGRYSSLSMKTDSQWRTSESSSVSRTHTAVLQFLRKKITTIDCLFFVFVFLRLCYIHYLHADAVTNWLRAIPVRRCRASYTRSQRTLPSCAGLHRAETTNHRRSIVNNCYTYKFMFGNTNKSFRAIFIRRPLESSYTRSLRAGWAQMLRHRWQFVLSLQSWSRL